MNKIMKRKTKDLICIIAYLLFSSCSTINDHNYRVESGEFKEYLTETGELQALNSTVIPMPIFDWSYGRPQITALEKEGTLVKKGQFVGQLDSSGVVRVLGQKRADLEIGRADFRKLAVRHVSQLKKLDADIQSSRAELRQARIDTQRVRFESQTKIEMNKLKLKIVEISYQKAKRTLEHTYRIQKEELLIQKLKIEKTKSEIQKAIRTIDRYILRAPADGMIVYRKKRRGEKVAIGDQLFPGEPIIGLPDLRKMKVLTSVSETDIEKIKLGQKVTVRLDAFPKTIFDGSISSISKICHEKDKDSKVKIFDVTVLLNQSARILRPGMTVSCEILVAEMEDALFVNNSCIYENGGEYFVFVKDGSGKKEVKVTIGPRNNNSVVVYGDLKTGDTILNSDRVVQ